MNEYDSNRIYDLVKEIGYIKTEKPDEANCYIINTCHIREKATEKVYHDVGRVKKNFRNKKKPIVIITGCVAQAEGEILLKKDSLLFFKPLSRDSFFSFVNSFLKKFILKKFNQRYIKQKKPLKSDFEYNTLKIFT